jgi:HK97 gp10 family phage protein
MAFEIQVIGLDGLLRDVERAGGDATALVRAAQTNSATHIQSEARKRAPHATGTLQRSIQIENDGPAVRVSVNEKYGPWVEYGTGIFGPGGQRITPKQAKVLRWVSGGKTIFARSIAGMRPRPFFGPAVEDSAEYIYSQFMKVCERLVRELAGHK